MKQIYLSILIFLSGCASVIDYKNGQKFDWEKAKNFINSNPAKIENVVQTHSLHINILLNDGVVLKTKEMYIDEIFDVLRKCGEPCKHIGWITQ